MKLKQVLLIIGISAVSAIGSVWVYGKISGKKNPGFTQTSENKAPVNYAGFFDNAADGGDPVDFTKASNAAVPAVVYIKIKKQCKKNQQPASPQPQQYGRLV